MRRQQRAGDTEGNKNHSINYSITLTVRERLKKKKALFTISMETVTLLFNRKVK